MTLCVCISIYIAVSYLLENEEIQYLHEIVTSRFRRKTT
jgi:hypothetical protein